ncbi:HET domain-containing protein [Microdochium nivale]|nr:HET domain-containing protein [Microdochium nivale]
MSDARHNSLRSTDSASFDFVESHESRGWPRRLLHVPSMRSLSWEPGNLYGGVREPRYNAISYTWGRFTLRGTDESTDVSSLSVEGIPWATPRVDPTHFTVAEFQNVLELALDTPVFEFKDKTEMPTMTWQHLEFVWVDVACIDQRGNQDSQLEIGRQAEIFRNASFVYVWLTRTTEEPLYDASLGVRYLSEEAYRNIPSWFGSYAIHAAELEPGYDTEWLEDGLEELRNLCRDPWFTSLWTLQEAYLRRDACFMSREGAIMPYQQRFDIDFEPGEADCLGWLFTIDELLFATENCRNAVEVKASAKAYEKNAVYTPDTAILQFLEASGLSALSRNNPLELYTASTNRKPSRINDSIYGIMQIFEFRLGASAPHAASDVELTLTDLEDELGLELMRLCPPLSQSFRHDHWPRETGQNWRISRQSTVPGSGFTDYVPWEPSRYISECVLGTTRIDGAPWATFSGLTCSFGALRDAWSYANDADTYRHPPWHEGKSDMCIVLDARPGLFPYLDTPDKHHIRRGPGQYIIASQLNSMFGSRLRVLHLGSLNLVDDSVVSHVGLLLLQPSEDGAQSSGHHWERIGVCTWQVGLQEPRLENASGPVANRQWTSGWRPLFTEPFPKLVDEETIEEVQTCWNTLALRNYQDWTRLEGIFG